MISFGPNFAAFGLYYGFSDSSTILGDTRTEVISREAEAALLGDFWKTTTTLVGGIVSLQSLLCFNRAGFLI